MNAFHWVCLVLGAVLTPCSLFFCRRASRRLAEIVEPTKQDKKPKKLWTIASVAFSWLLVVELLTLIFGPSESGSLSVEITAARWSLFGWSVSSTVVITWILMLILTVVAILIRLFIIPKMKDEPAGIQNVLEIAVEEIAKYTDDRVDGVGDTLGSYIFSLAVFMVSCACVELFGLRAPTADLTMTFAMALITFFLINYYGIRRKGIGGRIKSLAYPTAVVFPFKIISDIAVPVSLACRLFGNMLGGMIVMDLLYTAMGNLGVGVPSLLGLYFNVFHPLIQAFIFVTLTLTFIGEAVENVE